MAYRSPSTLPRTPAVAGDDRPDTVRILCTGTDPADEIHMTLAALSARAQQLVSDNVDHRVVRSGRSLYEVSRRAVESTQQQVQRATAASPYVPTSQASVELFMAKHLGFNVQEQQRLLQELYRSQQQMLADIASVEHIGGHGHLSRAAAGGSGGNALPRGAGSAFMANGGGVGCGAHTVDAIVTRLKHDIIAQAQQEMHLQEQELLQRHEHAVFRAAWDPFYVSMADDFEMLAMRGADPVKADAATTSSSGGGTGAAALATLRAQRTSSLPFATSALQGASGLATLLNSGSPVADEINRKVAAFAPIVTRYPPAQWISHFTAYIRDRVISSGDELAVLWVTAERILGTIHAQGSAANALTYVAASRQLMEEKTLGRLLSTTLRMDPARVEEVANMPSGRVKDVIARGSGTTNVWVHTLEAMRAGRYDVAAEAASQTGHAAVEAALRRWADATPQARASLPPALELRELYAETRRAAGGGTSVSAIPGAGSAAATNGGGGSGGQQRQQGQGGVNASAAVAASSEYDPHKQAVLFLLLAGATGESAEVNKRVLFELCSRVGDSIEGVLWMRLACVRTVEETAKEGPVQALSYLQRIILDDLQDLVTMAHGNIQRIAGFLISALLPSSGLRLLLENDVACVDGLHLTLCFHQANALQCSTIESPVDVVKHIARYCAIVLLDGAAQQRSLSALRAGASVFDYFHKMGFDEAFAEFCLKDGIAARLFGQRRIMAPAVEGSGQQQLDGLLLEGNEHLSVDLMNAMGHTAELAATRGNTPLALYLLLSLGRACLRTAATGARSSVYSRGRSGAAGGGGVTDPNACATSIAALQRAVKLAGPAMAQAFHMPPYTSYANMLFDTCAQLHAATQEAGVEALTTATGLNSLSSIISISSASALVTVSDSGSGSSMNGARPLFRAEIAAFESLCTMATVFLTAHGGALEQAMHNFFLLPFVPNPTRSAREAERCVEAVNELAKSSSPLCAAVLTAASAIVPLAIRTADRLMQAYIQQEQQQHLSGNAASEAAAANAAFLRQAMELVCEWLRACGGPAGGNVSGAAGAQLYSACSSDIADFQRNHLR